MVDLISKEIILSKLTADTYGTLTPINKELFKFTNSTGVLVIKKVSLNELFDNVPQDITWVTLPESSESPSESEEATLSILDELKAHFTTWVNVVGLRDLSFNEVNVSLAGPFMFVLVDKSPLYTGSVAIKIQ